MILSLVTMILMPVAMLLLMLIFITVNRYIRYRERVTLAQLGYAPEDLSLQDLGARRGSRGVLWGGVITATSGLALLLGLSTLGVGVWLIGGFLPLFVGLGMILIYFLSPASIPKEDGRSADETLGLEDGSEALHDEALAADGLEDRPWVKAAGGDEDGGPALDERSGREPAR